MRVRGTGEMGTKGTNGNPVEIKRGGKVLFRNLISKDKN